MITVNSIPYFPDFVAIDKDQKAVIDQQLGALHQVNEVGVILLELIDGKRSIREIALLTEKNFKWDASVVEQDLLSLASTLNHYYLLNIDHPFSIKSWLYQLMISILFFTKTLQGSSWEIKKRFTIESRTPIKIFSEIWWIVFKTYRTMILILTGLGTNIAFLVPNTPVWLGLSLPFFFITFMTAHEWGHIQSFLTRTGKNYPFFFATRRGAFQIIRPRTDFYTELIVSCAGPLPVFMLGLVGTGILILFTLPLFLFMIISFATVTSLVHGISLFPFSEDGKRMIEAFQQRKILQEVK